MTKQPEQSKRPNPLVSISTMASLMANGVQVHDWGELTCWLQMLTTGLQEGDSFDWAVHEANDTLLEFRRCKPEDQVVLCPVDWGWLKDHVAKLPPVSP